MAIWQHSVCKGLIENPHRPAKCILDVIPTCKDPECKFDPVNLYLWKCRSCSKIVLNEIPPKICPSKTSSPCSDVEGGTFKKICD